MKKLVAKAPGGRQVVINLYETPVPIDGSKSAAEYKALLRKEKEYDARLGRMAEEVSHLLDVAEAGEHAIDYWKAGRIMADHERELETRVAEAGEEQRYEQKGRTRGRLQEKVRELRRQKALPPERYQGHYFRKIIRFATMMSESQASRGVPYSMQHELLYDGLTPADRDDFLERCERGEIRTADALRAAVKSLLDTRKTAGVG
jgi:uncharacterized protein with von Willebrand factor type A (vWA) domain